MSSQIDWSAFDEEDDTGITENTEAVEVPKACSIDNHDCEACQ